MTKLPIPEFGTNQIANTLLKYNYKAKIGDILAGTFVGIEKNCIVINLGLKQVAFLPINEITTDSYKSSNQIFSINEISEFVILKYDKKTNKTIVSFKRLHYIRLWERFKQLDFKNMIFFTKFISFISGGKLIIFDELKIFIPSYHLSKYHKRKNIRNSLLLVKILKVIDQKHSIIASSKLALLKKQSSSLNIGFVYKACVLVIKPFGILLNLYGIKCLLHISEVDNKKTEKISNLYKKGDKINIKIIYINSSQGKIAVSAKNI